MAKCFGRIRLTSGVVGSCCPAGVVEIAFANACCEFVAPQFVGVAAVAHLVVDCRRSDRSGSHRGVVAAVDAESHGAPSIVSVR